jgi:starch synthase
VNPIRVLGVAQDAGGKWGRLFAALDEYLDVVDVLRPPTPQTTRAFAILRNWRSNLELHRLDPGWSWEMFDARSRGLQRALARRPSGECDVVVQAQTLFDPGRRAPYVIYTDSTMALNQRHRFGGDPTPGRRGERLRARERAVARGAVHVFTMSEFARRSLLADYGCAPDAVTVVGAGVNLEAVARESPPDRPRAILVGVDFERKGGLEVLAAWPGVRSAVPGAELVVAGVAQQAKLEGVHWAGRVGPAELTALYNRATVFVCPTLWDPWGLVFHEAMAHGLPCIGTDRFAVPEIIADGETGLLVPPRDAGAVEAALIALLGDPERARRMGAEAERRVRAEATWSAVAGRMAPRIEQIAFNGRR